MNMLPSGLVRLLPLPTDGDRLKVHAGVYCWTGFPLIYNAYKVSKRGLPTCGCLGWLVSGVSRRSGAAVSVRERRLPVVGVGSAVVFRMGGGSEVPLAVAGIVFRMGRGRRSGL